MRVAVKKLYISILVCSLVLLTCIATTYAWVGIISNSTFEEFTLNVNVSNLKEYGIEISTDGINFKTDIDSLDLKKQILLNYGYTEEQLSNDEIIESTFSRFNLEACTNNPDFENNKMSNFTTLTGSTTRKYFKFDIYISAYKVYETGTVTDFKLDTFLRGDILNGTVSSYTLFNEFTYPSNVISNTISPNQTISKTVVNSHSAARLAIEKYEVVEKYKPELYTDSSVSTDLIIYQGGTQNPSYNESTGIYSYGGILSDEMNLALYDFNSFYQTNYSVPSWAVERGTKELEINEENSQIIDSSVQTEQIGINDMMKLSFYFWFEGWDADCFSVVNQKPVSINLNFSTSYRE